MTEARRTVARWVLAALLERGAVALAAPPPEPRRVERPLSPFEYWRLERMQRAILQPAPRPSPFDGP